MSHRLLLLLLLRQHLFGPVAQIGGRLSRTKSTVLSEGRDGLFGVASDQKLGCNTERG